MRPYRRGGNGWLILSVAGFVLVILLGVLLASALPPMIDPLLRDAPSDETITLIAYLYDREGVLNNARERLGVLGEKGSDQTIADLANKYPTLYPDRTREAQSLQRLAKDLNLSRPTGAKPAGQSGKDDLSWLGWVLLAVFLLVMAGSFLASVSRGRLTTPFGSLGGGSGRGSRAGPRTTLGRSTYSPEHGDDEGLAPEEEAEPRGTAADTVTRWLQMPSLWLSKLTGNRDNGRPTRRERMATSRRPSFYETDEDLSRPWDIPSQPEPASGDPGRLLLSFQSSYRMGQDSYQEVYPILENDSALLIGACGLSPGLALDPLRPDKFHAMTVWLHDYRNPHVLRNTVLVSRGLYYDRPSGLEDWLSTQPIQVVLPAEPGRSMALEGAALRARVSVLEVETEPASNPNGPIAWMVLRFDISVKRGATPPTDRADRGDRNDRGGRNDREDSFDRPASPYDYRRDRDEMY